MLQQNFRADRPNQKWVLDSKLYYCKDKKYYLCVLEDLYARRILSWTIGPRENTHLVRKTIISAKEGRIVDENAKIILHTDNGTANTSRRAERTINELNLIHSYSHTLNPYDNAPIESFFSLFSRNFLADVYQNHPFTSARDMENRIRKFFEDYNNKHPHSYNDGLTPTQKENQYYRNRRTHKKDIDTRQNSDIIQNEV